MSIITAEEFIYPVFMDDLRIIKEFYLDFNTNFLGRKKIVPSTFHVYLKFGFLQTELLRQLLPTTLFKQQENPMKLEFMLEFKDSHLNKLQLLMEEYVSNMFTRPNNLSIMAGIVNKTYPNLFGSFLLDAYNEEEESETDVSDADEDMDFSNSNEWSDEHL